MTYTFPSNSFCRIGPISRERRAYEEQKMRDELRAAREWAESHGAPSDARKPVDTPYRGRTR